MCVYVCMGMCVCVCKVCVFMGMCVAKTIKKTMWQNIQK